MIVLLVDDELAVKEAMDIIIEWEAYGITKVLYAENGKRALEQLEEEKPDIMFCDMQMPVMDGKKLLEEMAARGLTTKVIAVSGYNDFSYVKATLQVKGIDYILKPIDGDEIIKALERAIALCKKETQESIKDKHYNKMKEEVSIHALRQWLDGKQKFDEEIISLLQTLQVYGEELFVAIVVFQNPLTVKEELFENDGNLLRFSLNNIVCEIYGNSRCQLIDIDEFFQIIIMNGKKTDTYRVMLDKFLRTTQDLFHMTGFYEFDNKAIPVEHIFKQVELMKYRMLSRTVQAVPLVKVRQEMGIGSIKGMESLLYSAMKDKNIDGINKLLTEFCNNLTAKPNLTYRELQFQTIEMNLIINRLEHEALNNDIPTIAPVSIWIFDIQMWKDVVKNRIYQLAEYQSEDRLNIEQVYRYLQEQYHENVTIDTLTEYFYQSPQNISRRFKERYNLTIVTALRHIRMEHAKKFLETSTMPVLEIARMCGYEDESYFGKVFKKETGYSPKYYRNHLPK